jgi:uncharacterized protein
MQLPGLGAVDSRRDITDAAAARDALLWVRGQLTALAVAPYKIDPRQWIAAYFSQKSLGTTKEERQGLYTFTAKLFNDIVASLSAAKDEFELPGEPYDVEQARKWANGFVDFMMEAPDQWNRLKENESLAVSLVPIRLLDFGPDEAAVKAEMASTLSLTVDELDLAATAGLRRMIPRLYRAAKTLRGPTPSLPATPGRNDPCPCGSGKKHKKCCGA